MTQQCELSKNHWLMENYRERMTVNQWRKIQHEITVDGVIRYLVAERIPRTNVVEVRKEPLK